VTHASHLSEGARAVLRAPLQARLDWSTHEYFIPHSIVVDALTWMRFCRLHESGRGRPRSLHVMGAPDAGKSGLLKYYAAQHGFSPQRRSDGSRPYPVILVEAPPSGNYRDLCQSLVQCCYPDFQLSRRVSVTEQCDRILLDAGVKQILIDEGGNLLVGGPKAQQVGLSFLKRLSNRGLTLVIATPENSRNVLAADEQLRSRFIPCVLPAWHESDEFRSFLAGIERELPFPEASRLSERACVRWFVSHQVLVTGQVVNTIRDATVIALMREARCLTLPLLDEAHAQRHAPDAREAS